MINKHPEALAFNHIFIAGIEGKRFDINIKDGRFSSIAETEPPKDQPAHPGQDLWISPGVIDLHTHLAWTDFDHEDQLKRGSHELEVMQAEAFEATLRTGVTTARDAGGILPSTVRHLVQHYQQPLRVQTSSAMLGAADARGLKVLEGRLAEILIQEQAGLRLWQQAALVHLRKKCWSRFFRGRILFHCPPCACSS